MEYSNFKGRISEVWLYEFFISIGKRWGEIPELDPNIIWQRVWEAKLAKDHELCEVLHFVYGAITEHKMATKAQIQKRIQDNADEKRQHLMTRCGLTEIPEVNFQ